MTAGSAMVSQEYALYPHLTVYDNLAFPLRTVKQAAPGDVDERVREVAARLSIDAPPRRAAA